MTLLWLITTMFGAAMAHVLFGSAGWNVPWLLLVGFYLSVAYGRRQTLPLFLVLAVCVDAAFAHTIPFMALLALPVSILAGNWRDHGDCRIPANQIVPAVVIGLGHGVGQILLLVVPGHGSIWQLPLLWQMSLLLLQSLLWSSLLLPILCLILDRIAATLELRRYADAQQQRDFPHGI